ncbi:MAG TPA: DNA mismatch repair endonuclease MutL [Elusimicrobiota bacterium]|nr:DNA mismatch repair endonuclease MutL [Elusimicrobiota bacterium]
MSKIKKLPETVIRHIAAGEVVERPASVLKELLENSLDAGARHVTVEWENAGRTKLRVTDDGSGMSPEDARLAVERHATSKISSIGDMDQIHTYGFRGEALPSIAAVSQFQLLTREPHTREGWNISINGGKIVREGPIGTPVGTTILIENLFFNTPARAKFLKSDATERGLLLRTIEDISLCALSVGFHVIADGKEILTIPPVPDGETPSAGVKARLAALWPDLFEKVEKPDDLLRAVSREGQPMKAWGWVSDIHTSQTSTRFQRLFINGRVVLNRRISHSIYEAYRGGLMVGRHPLAVLFLDIDPQYVDVNVHPSKREVRLSKENEVYGFVYHAVKESLTGSVSMPSVQTGTAPRSSTDAPAGLFQTPFQNLPPSSVRPEETEAALRLQTPVTPDRNRPECVDRPETRAEAPRPLDPESFRQMAPQALLQIDNTYILSRWGDELLIFDQHAVAERILYEKLSSAAKEKEAPRQNLLLPWTWELSPQAAAIVTDHLDDFRKMGYDIDPFGPRAFRIGAVPASLGDSPKVRQLLEGLVDDLLNESIPHGWEPILIRAACRGSIKANEPLQGPEMNRLLQELQQCRMPWSCPHGRPTFLRLSSEELARHFRRI